MSDTRHALGRRQMLKAGALVGSGLVLAACRNSGAGPAPVRDRRFFVDDIGREVRTAGQPRNVLCYLNLAGALWDQGIRCAGTYNAAAAPSPGDRSVSGNLDRRLVPSFGDVWGELDLEQVLAARVDLVVVGMMHGRPLLTEHDLAAVSEIAPILRLEMYARPLEETVARVADLAGALGGGVPPATLAARCAAYGRAREEFAAAIRAAPGLRTAFVAARSDVLEFSRPAYPIIALAGDLGLPVVTPDTPGTEYTLTVSWENADQYPVDLLLLDERPHSQQPEVLASNVIWSRLPAVRAGQVAAWNPEPVLSRRGLTHEFRTLASAVTRAHRL